MLSDAQLALLEPLIEACRPKGKTPPQDLRRTLSAILWRHGNGAKSRAVPEELGEDRERILRACSSGRAAGRGQDQGGQSASVSHMNEHHTRIIVLEQATDLGC